VDGRHDGLEVSPEPGIHPVVDERVEHGVGHGQPVEALKRDTLVRQVEQDKLGD
jgi:hypothetical protein